MLTIMTLSACRLHFASMRLMEPNSRARCSTSSTLRCSPSGPWAARVSPHSHRHHARDEGHTAATAATAAAPGDPGGSGVEAVGGDAPGEVGGEGGGCEGGRMTIVPPVEAVITSDSMDTSSWFCRGEAPGQQGQQ